MICLPTPTVRGVSITPPEPAEPPEAPAPPVPALPAVPELPALPAVPLVPEVVVVEEVVSPPPQAERSAVPATSTGAAKDTKRMAQGNAGALVPTSHIDRATATRPRRRRGQYLQRLSRRARARPRTCGT